MLFLSQLSQLDEALGLSTQLSNFTNLLTTYLPADQVALLSAKLPETFTLPSPGMLLVWGVAAICALAVLEQVKYQLERMGKGQRLPGATWKLLRGCLASRPKCSIEPNGACPAIFYSCQSCSSKCGMQLDSKQRQQDESHRG